MSSDVLEPESIVEIFLRPGDVYWGDRDTRIRTLLGSCVAICFWHPVRLEGGMCHITLPTRGNRAAGAPLEGRFADEAVQKVLLEMSQSRTTASEYQVKLFGGGNTFLTDESSEAVGERNIRAVYGLMKKYGFNIVSESLGGGFFWRLRFELWNGHVWVKKRPIAEFGATATQ